MDGFRKSSFSVNNGACVEVGNGFRKSTYSVVQECVEVGPGVRVRDSKQARGTRIIVCFTDDAWRDFIQGVKSS